MITLLLYAQSYLGVPYVWGGHNRFTGLDCSGYIQLVLRSVGEDPDGDQTAQTLYNHFRQVGSIYSSPKQGALVFYGKSEKAITHVALAIDNSRVIEAGGGGSNHKTLEACRKSGACVRIRPVNHRKDLVAIVMPQYKLLKEEL
jgi:cell wall-associated NlpC family hydrolase